MQQLGSMKNMQQSGNFFYINGDSYLAHWASKVANSDHPLFKNITVINHAVPGSGNLSIIRRTKHALNEFKKYNIYPVVCIGLSEVGRDLPDEFKLVPPQDNLTEYLKSILLKEIEMLEDLLQDHTHYIGTAWTTNPQGNKSIIDFTDDNFDQCNPVYAIGNGIYSWLGDRQKIFKFSRESFVEAVENKEVFQDKLLKNKYIDDTMHLDKSTSQIVYEKYFKHVFLTTGVNFDN